MAHSTRNNSKKAGKYITRNQQRKLDYARLAAQAAKKGGGDVVNGASKGRALKKTNHKKGFTLQAHQKRHEEAIYRNEGWASLTPIEQLGELDKRLGVGIGAVRQRAKIVKKLETIKTAPLSKVMRIIDDNNTAKISRAVKQARKEARDQRVN